MIVTRLAGCQTRQKSTKIDIEIVNYTSRVQPLQVSLIDPDNSEYSEAQVYRKEFQIPPPEGEKNTNQTIEPNIADRDKYIIRSKPKFGEEELYHYHYFPGEAATDPEDSEIIVRIYESGTEELVYIEFM